MPGLDGHVMFRASYAALGDWLDAVAARTGVPSGRAVLGGFSQGTATAWVQARRASAPLA